jgi:hypothetical protein
MLSIYLPACRLNDSDGYKAARQVTFSIFKVSMLKHRMKVVWQSIKQHPTSVIFYIIYCLLWYSTYGLIFHPMREGGLLVLAGIFTAIVFIIISLVNASQTNNYKFYLWLIVFIVIPVVIEFCLSSMQVQLK